MRLTVILNIVKDWFYQWTNNFWRLPILWIMEFNDYKYMFWSFSISEQIKNNIKEKRKC